MDVSRLQVIDERVSRTAERTGSERACLPSADTVRATAEIAFLKRHDAGIQVRHRDTYTDVPHHVVLRRDDAVVGEVDIAFRILRKRDVPYHVRAVFVLREIENPAQAIQEIAGGLHAHRELQIGAVRETLVVGRIGRRVVPIDDEMVLITRFQHRRAFHELLLESLRHPRQVDIVDIDEVELMGPAAAGSARKEIGQGRRGDRTGVLLRTLLIVVGDAHFDVRREQQSCLRFRLDGTTAVGAPFVRRTTAQREHLRAVENILVAIRQTRCHAPIAGAVGTFYLRRNGIETTSRNADRAV